MTATLCQLHESPTLVATAPARLLSHLQHGIQFPIRRTVLAESMGSALAGGTSPGSAFTADDLERMLRIYLAPFWDEFSTSRIGAENPRFPWCTEL
jgi:hypothetical protein